MSALFGPVIYWEFSIYLTFWQEINHAGAGGLWAELVSNRGHIFFSIFFFFEDCVNMEPRLFQVNMHIRYVGESECKIAGHVAT